MAHPLYSLLLRGDSIVVLRSQLLQLLRRRLHTHRIHSAQPSSLASQFLALAHHIDPLAFLRAAPQRPQRIALRSYSASHKPKPSASLLGRGRWHDSNISITASGLLLSVWGVPAELLARRVLLQPSLQLRPFARRRCPRRLECVEPRPHVIVQARLLSIMAAMLSS